MSFKSQLLVAGLLFVSGLAFGRWSAPTHSLTEKTQTEKASTLSAQNNTEIKKDVTSQDTIRTIEKRILPSGEKIITARTEKRAVQDKSRPPSSEIARSATKARSREARRRLDARRA